MFLSTRLTDDAPLWGHSLGHKDPRASILGHLALPSFHKEAHMVPHDPFVVICHFLELLLCPPLVQGLALLEEGGEEVRELLVRDHDLLRGREVVDGGQVILPLLSP